MSHADTAPESLLSGVSCSACERDAGDGTGGACEACGAPLLCRYELAGFAPPPARARADSGGAFRWAALLPVKDPARRRSLGEADAPFTDLPSLAEGLGLEELVLLRDGAGPSGSSSARGFAVAAAAWAERGAKSLTLASAGPSAAPFAAAARRQGLGCRVALPTAATPVFRLESRLLKARVVAVLGDRGVAGRWVETHPGDEDDRVLSAFCEPFRLEGAKTLAFEIWERYRERLPDVVVVPTGSGMGLAALHRGFVQLREAGLLEAAPPQLVAAQVESCAPIVKALGENAEEATPWGKTHRTLAESLRDPEPRGSRLSLRALRETGGAAQAVSEAQLVDALRGAAKHDAVLSSAEGAVGLAALAELRLRGGLEGARVLCLDPLAPWRSPEAIEAAGTG